MTSGDVIGWGLAVLFWIGVTAGAVALAFGIAVVAAFAADLFRK